MELTARLTSPSAWSSLTEWVSWPVRASSSLKRRTFSIAITAWSAKVCIRLICRSPKARASARQHAMTPTTVSSRSIGTARNERYPPACWVAARSGLAGSESTSSTWMTRRSRTAWPMATSGPGR